MARRPGEMRVSLAVLELIQKESGEIVLQAEDGDEPLLSLRFSDQLTELLGADAISLAQAMIESASHAFEYAADAGAAELTGSRSAGGHR